MRVDGTCQSQIDRWRAHDHTRTPTPHHTATPPATARSNPTPLSATTAGESTTGPSLRERFFAAVQTELAQRFPDPSTISRILRFVENCKAGVIPPEAPTNLLYFQPSEEFVPGLSARPWHEPHAFPWVPALEEAAPQIRAELERVLAEQRAGDFKGDSSAQQTVMGAGWTALRLQRFGIWNEDVCARFPQTVKVRCHRHCGRCRSVL